MTTEPQPEPAPGERLKHYAHRILAWCMDDRADRETLGSIVSDMLKEAK